MLLRTGKDFLNSEKLILALFVFLTLFPSIRVLLIGAKTSVSFVQYFISLLPELFFVFILAVSFANRNKQNSKSINAVDYCVAIFFILNVIVGSFLSADLKLIFYGIRLSYLPVLFYFMVRFNLAGEINFKKLLRQLFNWFTVIGLIGILLYFFFRETMLDMIAKSEGKINEYFVLRMTSVFWTPVVFGTLMSLTTTYWFHVTASDRRWHIYARLSIAFCALIFSISRGAIFAAGLAVIFLYLRDVKNKGLIFSFLTMLIIYIACSFYIKDPITFTGWLISSSGDTINMNEDVQRVKFWKQAYESFTTKPLGYGLGRAGHTAARFFTPESKEAVFYSTDGWYLKLLCESGIQGVIFYFAFIISFIIFFLKRKFRNPANDIIVLVMAFFINLNFQNMVSNVLDFFLVSYLFWLLIAIGINSQSQISIVKNDA